MLKFLRLTINYAANIKQIILTIKRYGKLLTFLSIRDVFAVANSKKSY